MTLGVIDFHLTQDFEDVRMFDRLGDGLDVQYVTDMVDRFDQGPVSGVFREPLNEPTIDFYEVDRESSQVCERAQAAA